MLEIMVTLVLYGDIKDKSITSKLCRVLSDYGGVLYFTDTKTVKYGNFTDTSFIIYECDNLQEITIPNSIVIFKSKQTNEHIIKLSNSVICITESSNHKAIASIQGNNSTCISCGMSGNDSVTLSSISDTDAIISIQRSLTDINGKTIEPCDITVKFKQFYDGFSLLSIFCFLILSGKNEGYILNM